MWRNFINLISRREVLVLLGSLAILLVLLNPPQALVVRHHAWKGQAAEKAAREASDAGDWDLALERATAGLRWTPRSFELRRIVAEAASAQGKAVDPMLLAGVFLDSAATPADHAKMLQIALDGGDQVTFSRFYNALTETARKAPAIAVQRMRLGSQLRRHEEVLHLFEQLPASERSPQVQLHRIGALIGKARSRGDFVAAQREISQLISVLDTDADAEAESNPLVAWQTFRLIAAIPTRHLDRQALTPALAWFESREETGVADQLIAASVELSALPQAEQLAHRAAVVERHRGDDAAAVGRWLVGLGFAEEALEIPQLAPAAARDEVRLFDARLEALVAAGHFDEAQQWLENPPKGSHAVMLWLARARIAHQLDQRSERRQSLTRAIEAATIMTSENTFFDICDVAQELGEYELAARAARHGLEIPFVIAPPAPFFLPVLRYLWQADRMVEFRDLNRALLQREPGSFDLSNDELYVSLLLDEAPRLPQIVEIGRRLVLAKPQNLSFRTTLAWALLRSDLDDEALSTLEDPGLDWSQAGPADRLLRALVWLENGDADKAGETMASVDESALCSAERQQLLEDLRSRLESVAVNPRP